MMKVIRNSDSLEFTVYDIKNTHDDISFLIYEDTENKWAYYSADEFTPNESEYFG